MKGNQKGRENSDKRNSQGVSRAEVVTGLLGKLGQLSATVAAIRSADTRGGVGGGPAIVAGGAVGGTTSMGSIASLIVSPLASLLVADSVEASVSAARAHVADRSEGVVATAAVGGAVRVELGIANLIGLNDSVSASGAGTELVPSGDPSGLASTAIRVTSSTEAVALLTGIEISVSAAVANSVVGLVEVIINASLTVIGAVQVVLNVADLASVNNAVTALGTLSLHLLAESGDPSSSASRAVVGALGGGGVAELAGIEFAVSAQGTSTLTVGDVGNFVARHADALLGAPLGHSVVADLAGFSHTVSAGNTRTCVVENEALSASGTIVGAVLVQVLIADLTGKRLNKTVSAGSTTSFTVGDHGLRASAVIKTVVINLEIAIFVGGIENSVVALSEDARRNGAGRVSRDRARRTGGDVPVSSYTLYSELPVGIVISRLVPGVGNLDDQVEASGALCSGSLQVEGKLTRNATAVGVIRLNVILDGGPSSVFVQAYQAEIEVLSKATRTFGTAYVRVPKA